MSTVSLHRPAGKWIMISAVLASAMAFIDGTALNVVLPSLQQNLHAQGADLFWILNAYLLILASLILIGGSIGDKLGRRKIFMAGILLFIIGSAACGFSPDVTYLILFRIIQGVGGALMIPGSLSLISSSIDEKERGKAIGTWSSITTVVTLGGPILGGALADAGLWRYIFFINIPIGLIALLILWRKVAETKDEDSDPSIDISGAVTIALGLAFLTFGFLRVPVLGWTHWQVLTALAAGLILLTVFLLLEKKGRHPMMPLDLFSNQTFSAANALTFFLYAGLGAGMLFLSLDLVQVQGYSQLQSGLTFIPFTILMLAFARLAGKLSDKFGPKWFLVGGPAGAGLGLYLLSLVGQTRHPSDYWTSFFPGILALGLGMSFTVAPLTATVMGSVSGRHSGVASGINNSLTRIASVFANAIFGALAVLLFSGALGNRIKSLPLDNHQKQLVMGQAVNLGNAKVPPSLGSAGKSSVEKAFHESFIEGYAAILRLSAVLAFLGALMSLLFIKNGAVKKENG